MLNLSERTNLRFDNLTRYLFRRSVTYSTGEAIRVPVSIQSGDVVVDDRFAATSTPRGEGFVETFSTREETHFQRVAKGGRLSASILGTACCLGQEGGGLFSEITARIITEQPNTAANIRGTKCKRKHMLELFLFVLYIDKRQTIRVVAL